MSFIKDKDPVCHYCGNRMKPSFTEYFCPVCEDQGKKGKTIKDMYDDWRKEMEKFNPGFDFGGGSNQD